LNERQSFQDEHGKIHYGQPILDNEELKLSDLQKGLKAHLIEGDIYGEHIVTNKSCSVKKVQHNLQQNTIEQV
jgi:hypothetical protein